MELMVRVTTNSQKIACSWYEVEFAHDRVFLRRPGDLDAITILVGTAAISYPPGTVRLGYQGADLTLKIPKFQYNSRRLASHLAMFISGHREAPIVEQYQFPAYLTGLSLLPLAIPLISNGKLVPSLVGIGLTYWCWKISRDDSRPIEKRTSKILVISCMSIAAYIALVAYLLFHLQRVYSPYHE